MALAVLEGLPSTKGYFFLRGWKGRDVVVVAVVVVVVVVVAAVVVFLRPRD